jgi:ketosteroid isomerase-like protein
MKILVSVLIALCSATAIFAQKDLVELIQTEKAFAGMAAEKGTKPAFLEYLADDSVVFNPDKANGLEVWKARKESPALLSWYPSFADVSSNGAVGYTMGPWEYRPKGKSDAPVAFGHFMTVWQRQRDGRYKAVLDIGVDHDKPAAAEPEASTTAPNTSKTETNSYAGDSAARFFEVRRDSGPVKAYKDFASPDIRLLRDKKAPIIGKKAAIKEVGERKGKLTISKRMSFYGSGDLAYATNTYSQTLSDGSIENGNFVQVWKYVGGKWLIVMDVFVAKGK